MTSLLLTLFLTHLSSQYIEGLTKEVEKNKEEIKMGERRNRELTARNDILVKTEREILKVNDSID